MYYKKFQSYEKATTNSKFFFIGVNIHGGHDISVSSPIPIELLNDVLTAIDATLDGGAVFSLWNALSGKAEFFTPNNIRSIEIEFS